MSEYQDNYLERKAAREAEAKKYAEAQAQKHEQQRQDAAAKAKAAEDAAYAALSEAEAEKLSGHLIDSLFLAGESQHGPRTQAHRRQLHGIRVTENNKTNWRETLRKRRAYVAEQS